MNIRAYEVTLADTESAKVTNVAKNNALISLKVLEIHFMSPYSFVLNCSKGGGAGGKKQGGWRFSNETL